MIDVQDLSAGELAALLHFYADAGVGTLLEEEPTDRFAQFEAEQKSRPAPAPRKEAAANRSSAAPARPATPAPAVTIPGEDAVAAARRAALAAGDVASLFAAVSAFEGCNLKNSARNTVFPSAPGQLPILVFGPAPSAEDDRAGEAFSGTHGDLFQKMFKAIGIEAAEMTLAHAIPWRPPGGRLPSPAEAEICRPFADRLITLVKPRFIVLMGNFTARFFTGSQDSIHALRGQWLKIKCGGEEFDAMAMLHPQDLITAPASKRLAWEDLLDFEARFNA